jgi:Flp pilus assembly pilin Flp
MRLWVTRIWQDDAGQDMVEYALVVALVAIGSAVLMPIAVHHSCSQIMSKVSSCLERFGGLN